MQSGLIYWRGFNLSGKTMQTDLYLSNTFRRKNKFTESSKINQFYFKNSILRFAISQVANK